MTQQKTFIQNRNDEKIVVLVDHVDNSKGLAFVMHGLGGFKEQPHIQTFADAFLEKSFTVVRFDTTNTLGLGESAGNYADATTTNYYHDLEDVIAWASAQQWYMEPFVLVGHSLGGIATALYAEKYPSKVLALAPISTVVSGELSVKTKKHLEIADEWKRTGWRESKSESQPGLIKRLKWSHVEDRLKYNLLSEARNLSMPVLLIVGENDDSTPLGDQKILFDAIPGDKKEMHIIKGAPHTFRELSHLAEIKKIIDTWLKRFFI